MTFRKFQGVHRHPSSGVDITFEAQYEFKPIGVRYDAHALVDGKRARIVFGVIAWGWSAFPPRRRIEQAVRESIEFIDMDKLRASLNDV